ncbi:MAG: restriction endonuclease subunit S [Ruminococcus sp.]|nr:restriction endonuclease subunit S [Ruminococcus sp.]
MRKMKDSGVEWVGEIPEHWEVHKIKNNFKIISGSGFDIRLQGNSSGEIPICKASDISKAGHYLTSSENYLSYSQSIANGFKIIPKGSILFAKIGEAMRKNRRTLTCVQCGADNNCQAIVPNNIISNYSYYIMLCVDISLFDNNGTIPCINNSKFKNSKFPYPPIEEQEKISAYLDEKCGYIDNIISGLKKQTDLLAEYKKALITETVTKGLNKDVKMKDSGIEWIGKMPAHWQMKKLKYIAELSPHCDFSKISAETEIEYLPMEYIKNGYYIHNSGKYSEVPDSLTPFESGDIVFAKVTPCFENGNIAIMNNIGVGSSELYVIRPYAINRMFIFFWLQNSGFIHKAVYSMTGMGGLKRVPSQFINNLPVLLPPAEEQEKISTYLDEKCKTIDKIISDKKRQIQTIEDYKKSLIYEVVTGKKEI